MLTKYIAIFIHAVKLWWRKRPLRKGYSTFYSFKGKCIVSPITPLNKRLGVRWLSLEKLLIYDNPSPVVGDLLCVRSRENEQAPFIYLWYALTGIQNPGPDDINMYGNAVFVVWSYTEEIPA